ncbi:hypothetical protein C8F04DRAFT_969440, partial [Mycena alexandri]
TSFRWIKGHAGNIGNEEADKLASEGASKTTIDEVDMKIDSAFLMPGAKLQSITQSLAYKMIRKIKMRKPTYQEKLQRKATKRNMALAQEAVADDDDGVPPPSTIWKSTRHKDLSRSVRFFLWMLIHDGYKVGKHWDKIEGHEEKAECRICGIQESMEHILTRCDVAGQTEVWELASELWKLKTGGELPKPTTGQIMACAAGLKTKCRRNQILPHPDI